MNILLTGASGFLGSHIYNSCKKFHHVKTIGRLNTNDTICDLTKEIPFISNVDFVIHSAGKAHIIPKNEIENLDFFKTNVQGTKNLLIGMEAESSIKKVVFISSVSVYGLSEGLNIQENNSLNAFDAYGKSKILAEELIENWCKKQNIDYYILRLPLIAGINAPGNLGAMVKGIKYGKYARIGKANAKKSMVLAEDIANFITNISGPSGIYNLTDGIHPSFAEIEKKIASNFKKNEPVKIPYIVAKLIALVGDLLGEKFPINSKKLKKITSSLTFSDQKARNLLNWNPRSVLENWIVE